MQLKKATWLNGNLHQASKLCQCGPSSTDMVSWIGKRPDIAMYGPNNAKVLCMKFAS